MRSKSRGQIACLVALALWGCAGPAPDLERGLPPWAVSPEEAAATPTYIRSASVASAPRLPLARLVGLPRDLTAPLRSPRSRSKQPAAHRSGRPSRTAPAPKQPPASPRPASSLERMYEGRFGREANRRLEQFGYSTFGGLRGRVDDVGPVPDDYVVGPGDELVITISGSFNDLVRAKVDRDGRISIPELGAIPLAGRRFDALQRVLTSAYGKRRRDFDLTVALGRIRKVRLQVVGLVARPGPVEVPANAGLLVALAAAGGPRKNGSLRRVELRRGATAPRSVDLYRFLLGRSSAPQRLRVRAGDVIHVPPIGPTVGVAGYVRRPGIYELASPGQRLEDALALAGGLTPFTYKLRLQLERTVAGRARRTVALDLPAARKRSLRDGDLLLVGAVEGRLQPLVQVEGAVVRPGRYAFRRGLRIRDLLELCDGLTADAFQGQAFISRQLGSSRPEARPGGPGWSSDRRVLVIDLARALRGEPEHDLRLQPLDLLRVRSRRAAVVLPTVSVLGAVQRPATYELTEGLRASDLVALAGNPLPTACCERAELVRLVRRGRANELNVLRYRVDLRRALAGDRRYDPVLRDGDRLILRSLRRAQVRVRVEGEVRFPGEYVLPAGARISDLLRSGRVLTSADLRASVFTRRSVQRLQRDRYQHLVERTRRLHETALQRLVRDGRSQEALAGKLALQQSQGLIRRLKRRGATGRVIVPLSRRDFPRSRSDLLLEDGDRILVKRRRQTVSVVGLVFNPSTFVAQPGLTVETLLARAGGVVPEEGDEERLYLIQADGIVRGLDQDVEPLELDTVVRPGDVVLVPRKPLERSFGAQMADALALTRQMAEIALILAKTADPKSSVDLTSHGGGALPGYQDGRGATWNAVRPGR